LTVLDQWKNATETHAVDTRIIKFKGGQGKPSNDGDQLCVIEDFDVINRAKRVRIKFDK